jgi:thiol:disulfide interchange protein DsbD
MLLQPKRTMQILALSLASLRLSSAADNVPAPANGEDLVRARLVAENTGFQSGKTNWLAVQLTMKPGWHTYWRNPGDSGLATSVKWTLPRGVSAEPIVWPQPDRFIARTIVGFGYSGQVALLTGVKVPPTLASGTLKIDGVVSWLACASVCIPGSEKLTIALPVSGAAPKPDARNTALFAQTRQRVPQRAGFEATFSIDEERITLNFPSSALPSAKANAMFYPFDNGVIDHSAAQSLSLRSGEAMLQLQRSAVLNDPVRTLDGLLILEDAARPGTGMQIVEISARRATTGNR